MRKSVSEYGTGKSSILHSSSFVSSHAEERNRSDESRRGKVHNRDLRFESNESISDDHVIQNFWKSTPCMSPIMMSSRRILLTDNNHNVRHQPIASVTRLTTSGSIETNREDPETEHEHQSSSSSTSPSSSAAALFKWLFKRRSGDSPTHLHPSSSSSSVAGKNSAAVLNFGSDHHQHEDGENAFTAEVVVEEYADGTTATAAADGDERSSLRNTLRGGINYHSSAATLHDEKRRIAGNKRTNLRQEEKDENKNERKGKDKKENESSCGDWRSSIPSSPLKISYSSDDIDRLLQMTPQKTSGKTKKNKNHFHHQNRKKLMTIHKPNIEMSVPRNKKKSTSLHFISSFSKFTPVDEPSDHDEEDENHENNLCSDRSFSKECLLCLERKTLFEFHTIWSCCCSFCQPCLTEYLSTNIRENNPNLPFLTCPDANCPMVTRGNHNRTNGGGSSQQLSGGSAGGTSGAGVKALLNRTLNSLLYNMNMNDEQTGDSAGGGSSTATAGAEVTVAPAAVTSSFTPSSRSGGNTFSPQEIRMLVDEKTFRTYIRLKTMIEVERDPYKAFCPTPNCDNICLISKPQKVTITSSLSNSSTLSSLTSASTPGVMSVIQKDKKGGVKRGVAVYCSKCEKSFCSNCRGSFHFPAPCPRPSDHQGEDDLMLLLRDSGPDGPEIKRCPQCSVWIERDDGCAQMMCRKCNYHSTSLRTS